MDMMSLFGASNIFGEEFAQIPVESQKEKKVSNKTTDTKKEKKSTSKKAAAEKCPDITLPCVVYGSHFCMNFAGEGTITGTQLIEKLCEAGIKEASSDARSLYVNAENPSLCFLVSDTYSVSTSSDTVVTLPVTVCIGQENAEYTESMFEEGEDVSLGDILDKFVENFAHYSRFREHFYYDSASSTITLVMNTSPSVAKEKATYPLTLVVNGEERMIDEVDNFGKTMGDIAQELTKEYLCGEVTASFSKIADQYILCYQSIKAAALNKKSGKAAAKKKEERYPSDCIVFLCFNGYTEQLTAEKFGGKEKIKKEDLIEYFKSKFAVFNSAEKVSGICCFYDNIQNRLSVDCTPGRRGGSRFYNAAYDFEETEHYVEPEDHPIYNNGQLKAFLSPYCTCYNREIMFGEKKGQFLFANYVAAFFYRKRNNKKYLFGYTRKIPAIPKRIKEDMIQYFREAMPNEAICRIMYERATGEFILVTPNTYNANKISVGNAVFAHCSGCELVATFHSHNSMPAFFSSTDDRAELDQIGMFGVIGRLDEKEPQILVRATYEGSQISLPVEEVFA